MGQDKALLPLPSGESLLTRTCHLALACCARVWVLSPRLETYAPLLPPGCQAIAEPRQPNEPPPGPLVAFAWGLQQLDADWILLLACDLPFLEAETLIHWLPRLHQAHPETTALLPQISTSPDSYKDRAKAWDKAWEPLCGFYRRSCLDAVQRAIAQGHRSFQRWLATESVEALPVHDPRQLHNCNRPEDLS